MSRWPFRGEPPPGAVRGDPSTEIAEELELYLELRTEELVAGGMDPVAARREAEARFGDPEEVARRMRKESGRSSGRLDGRTMMGQVWQDLGYALRSVRRNPGFALVAVLTLGVALGGNTAIFSVLDSAVLRALPFPDHERLVFVNGYHLQEGQRAIRMASIPEFRDWQERSRSIEPMVAADASSVTLGGEGGAERVVLEFVSEGYFDLLGATPVLGRGFTSEELSTPDGFPVVVLSHDLWQSRYAGAPDVLGRTLDVDGRTVTVVGVMSPGFSGANLSADLWAPLAMIGLAATADLLESRGTRFLGVLGRLAPGADAASAERELEGIARELQGMYPDTHEDRYAEVVSFREGYLGTTGRLLWILFGAGALLLVIASANVANLLLVRADSRSRELVVRRALGADGRRISRQLLTESLALAAAGGAVGLLLATWALRLMTALLPAGVLPAYAEPGVSARVFLFTLAVLTVVGLAAGMLPAVSTARRDLAGALRSGGRGSTRGGSRAQRVFVVTQVGLALLLMVGAGLLGRSFQAQLRVDPGLEMDGIHAFAVVPPQERYPDGASLRQFADEVTRAVSAVPGLRDVAVSSDFPFRGGSSGAYVAREDDPANRIRYHRHSVTPGYFRNLGVELLAGRFLEESDDENAPGAVVVTEAFVDRVFPEASTGVGERFWIGNPADPTNLAEVVGVVENVRYRNLTADMMDGPNSPDVFFAFRQVPSRGMNVAFRAETDVSSALPAIRRAVADLDPELAVFGMSSLRELYEAQTATPRFAAFLMALLSGLALSLACVGIYGILSFTVGQRAQEIAVRRALGARAGTVARAVVWDGVRLTILGLVVGGMAAWFGGGLLDRFLFQVEAGDPFTFIATAAAMLLVAVVAAAVPAWRATRRAPVEALTAE
ncbi:MAG: ABC transporter permease [Longimicrobiales bacterium]